MRFKALCVLLLLCGLWPVRAAADNRIIIRSTLSLQALQTACNPLPLPLLPQLCHVIGGLGDPQQQLFLITSSLDLSTLLNLPGNPLGIIDAELDQLISLIGGVIQPLTLPLPDSVTAALSDAYNDAYNSAPSDWNGYANQPAALIVGVQAAQSQFGVRGSGIVADIDTGVDPNHPAFAGVLLGGGLQLPSYDFTRNQPGASELNDLSPDFPTPPPACSGCSAIVNQSSAAILDQSSAAILDGNPQYAAFGHGTMVLGVVHLVAPTAQLLPLKAFSSNGTGNLSDILRAIYYAVQQGNANVINMSFDFKTPSTELSKALDYASQQGVVCAASAGNDGQAETVYPAALRSDVMGVASTNDVDQRSYFSNYGNSIVWVDAPGEGIVTTYPFSTYAAGWGTSFSAPFISGAAALLWSKSSMNESSAATAVSHAVYVGPDMGYGRLDLVQALGGQVVTGDFSISVSPSRQTIRRGSSGRFTVTTAASGGFTGTVSFSASGLPSRTSASFRPSSITASGSSVLTLRVGQHAARGTYTLTITGTSGSSSHSDTATLTIR